MLDAKNVVTISGGLVDVPEITGSVAKFRLAVDYAANEKDSDNTSGYFNVKYFLNNDNNNATFVKSQIDQGNFKKGSSVAVVGRLVQDRWADENGNKRQGVTIVAESMTYVGSPRKEGEATTGDGVAQVETIEVPDNF